MADQQKRIDPPSRPVDGSVLSAVRTTNADPERQYVWANPNDEWTGVAAMVQRGYVVETKRKDGPRLVGGETASDGSAMTSFGQILMSRPIAMMYADQEHARRGAFARRQAMGRPGGVDQVRGDGGSLAQVSIRH